jgi:signal transduction histidine kinase
LYGIESYIAVPISRRDGSYFGTLCALDPLPASLSEADFEIFNLCADLIAFELEAEDEKIEREAHISILNDLISMSAHDLRQPLSAVQLRVQLATRRAKREGVSPEMLAHLEQLENDVQRTNLLMDTLLDISRIEAGNFSLELADVDVVHLLQQAVNDLKSVSADHTFEVETSQPSIEITADATRLSQVFANLLNNAVKYTPNPAPTQPIKVKLEVDNATNSILIQVRDYGMGVEKSELPKLFERQYRSEQAIASGIKGSGFGLYISRKIIQAHKGNLWAEIVPDGGLRFFVKLSLEFDKA